MELIEKTVRSERVWQGNIFGVDVMEVTLPNGHTARRDVVRHPGAVCVLALTDDNCVLMERQWRAGYGGVTFEIPAGKLEGNGEEPQSAALRELREETGATAARVTYLGAYYGSPAILDERIHMYLAEGLSFGETAFDDDELIELEKIPLATLKQMALSGELPDGKTQCAVLRVAAMRGV